MHITTSYEIVTLESASEGDAAERGWRDEEGEYFETVEEAAAWLRRWGAVHFSVGGAFKRASITGREWYSTEPIRSALSGGDRTESFHLNEFTAKQARELHTLMMPTLAKCYAGVE